MARMTTQELQDRLAADFLLVDGLEPVTWNRHAPDGTVQTVKVIDKALRRQSDEETTPGRRHTFTADEVITTRDHLVWHFLRSAIEPDIPREGDTILDGDGVLWIVWQVQLQSLRVRYRLTCVRE